MNPLNRRTFLTAAAGTSLAGMLAACGSDDNSGGGNGDGTLDLRMSWWGSDAINGAVNSMVDLANQNVEGVSIEGEFTAFDTYFDRLTTQVASDNHPDLFEMSVPGLREYAENGALLELDGLDSLDLSTYSDAAVDVGKVNGTLYGVPWGVAAQTAFLDVGSFESAGVAIPDGRWTWSEFADAMQTISDATEEGFYGTGDHGGYDTFLEIFVRQRGSTLFTADGLGFTPEDLTAWLTYWEELRQSGAATPADVTAEGGLGLNDSPMIRGLAAVRFAGINILGAVRNLNDGPADFTSFPVAEDGTTGQYPRPAVYFCASSATEDPEKVGEVMNYILNDPEAREPLGLLLGVPASSTVAEELSAAGDEDTARVIEYTASETEGAVAPEPAPVGANTVRDLLKRANEEVGFGSASVDQAVEQFFTEAEGAFA